MRVHPGGGDCERVRPGLVAQPVNAASSLAYLAAAAWVWRRGDRSAGALAYCVAVGANGVGSAGFHGPGDRRSHRLHDAALYATVLAGAGAARRARPSSRAVALLVLGAAADVLGGRTWSPGCRPRSWWQWHAVWHLLTAAALADWGQAAYAPRGTFTYTRRFSAGRRAVPGTWRRSVPGDDQTTDSPT